MLRNPVKEKIERGEVSYGIYLDLPSPDILEFCGHLGFEWAFIDAEHGAIGRETCVEMTRACDVVGMVPIVRVPEIDRGLILSYLEAGALGIIAPHVNTAADARALVEAVKYPPLGRRGAGQMRRANYGLTQTSAEWLKRANEITIVDCLVEEIEGVRNLDEILAVEGVDVVGIGPGDLSCTMGLPGQAGHPDVRKVVDEAEARIVASGRILDAVEKDAEGALKAVERGALLVAISFRGLMADACRDFFAKVRR